MKTAIIDDLIVRFLSEDINRRSALQLVKWIGESPENESYFREQCKIWNNPQNSTVLEYFDADAAWERMRSRIARTKKASAAMRSTFALTAAAAALFVVGRFSYHNGQKQLKSAFADIVIEAPAGSQSHMFLPDGSDVWLNAGSKISYTQGFGVTTRGIKLCGEGYFEVQHNKLLPFVVESENLEVRVLGTKFNFKDYPDDATAEVSLKEGRISLSRADGNSVEHILTPDNIATLDKHSGIITTRKAASVNDWTNGDIVFDDTPFEQITKVLCRAYGIPVVISEPSLGSLRFSGEFSRKDHGLKDILDALAGTCRIRYRITEDQVTIF